MFAPHYSPSKPHLERGDAADYPPTGEQTLGERLTEQNEIGRGVRGRISFQPMQHDESQFSLDKWKSKEGRSGNAAGVT